MLLDKLPHEVCQHVSMCMHATRWKILDINRQALYESVKHESMKLLVTAGIKTIGPQPLFLGTYRLHGCVKSHLKRRWMHTTTNAISKMPASRQFEVYQHASMNLHNELKTCIKFDICLLMFSSMHIRQECSKNSFSFWTSLQTL